jgi:protoporphyrinogen oxidase
VEKRIAKPERGTIVVLGGGLAGLSALWHLQHSGYDKSLLFEQEARVGGLTRSETVDGFTFDYTGHLLHFKHEAVRKLVSELLGDNIRYMARNSWIFSKGVYTRYPFQTNLYGLPPAVIKECILGFVNATANNLHGANLSNLSSCSAGHESFEAWIHKTLGSGIAKHFMIPYNQKLWTVSPRELTCEWMGRFVPGASLGQILDGALSDVVNNNGYNAHFGYPLKGGIEALPRAFARSLKNIYCGFEVTKLDVEKKQIYFENGENVAYDTLVSSIPLTRLIRVTSNVPASVQSAANTLRFTSVYNINFGVDRNLSDKHWVYFPEPRFAFYRVGFSHNFSPFQAPPGCSSIYAEVSYSPWKPMDKSQIARRVKQDLLKLKILRRSDSVTAEHCLDIPCAYVLYDQNYRRNVDYLQTYVRQNDIRTIGRYGSWEYSGMEDAIWQGRAVATELLK